MSAAAGGDAVTDPITAVRRLALEGAAERLGLDRPVAVCSLCGSSLRRGDTDLPCEDGCPAAGELEAVLA